MYALVPIIALALCSLMGPANAQEVYNARLMQGGKCLAPDTPTFNSPVNFQDCNKNPYQWWEIRNSTIHVGSTEFCLSSGRSPRHRCSGSAIPKPGATFYLVGCPRDGTEAICESWTFKDGHLQNVQNPSMCVAGGAKPVTEPCSNACDQVWEHTPVFNG